MCTGAHKLEEGNPGGENSMYIGTAMWENQKSGAIKKILFFCNSYIWAPAMFFKHFPQMALQEPKHGLREGWVLELLRKKTGCFGKCPFQPWGSLKLSWCKRGELLLPGYPLMSRALDPHLTVLSSFPPIPSAPATWAFCLLLYHRANPLPTSGYLHRLFPLLGTLLPRYIVGSFSSLRSQLNITSSKRLSPSISSKRALSGKVPFL